MTGLASFLHLLTEPAGMSELSFIQLLAEAAGTGGQEPRRNRTSETGDEGGDTSGYT